MKDKPSLPTGYPLYAHSSGQLAKKIRGKVWYFGKWDEKDAALAKYLDEKDEILAGRDPRKLSPRKKSGSLTVAELCNVFLTYKKQQVDNGEIVYASFGRYLDTCRTLCKAAGRNTAVESLGPQEFVQIRAGFPANWAVATANSAIIMTRTVFRYAEENMLIEKPVRFGSFKVARAKAVRKSREARSAAAGGRFDLSAFDARSLLAEANPTLRACMLLGLNCGFGNTDCAMLPKSAINFETRWVVFPRPKTGVNRRVRLWPETLEAIQLSLSSRPEPVKPEDDGLVFLSRAGKPLVFFGDSEHGTMTHWNLIATNFTYLTRTMGVYKPGIGFYSCRRTFETVAGETCDQVVVDAIMGHLNNSMAEIYRQGLGGRDSSRGDERIEKVVNHVREWLWHGALGST